MICSVAVAVAQANKKDWLQLVATGLSWVLKNIYIHYVLYRLKYLLVLLDECVCGRAGMGGVSGGGGCMHAGGETLVGGDGGGSCKCVGGEMLVGGDGHGGHEPCEREDIGGGRWWWWSRACGRGDVGGGRWLCIREI